MSVTQAPDGDDRHAVLAPVGTTNSLTDATTYTPVGEEDMKGAFFSEGQLAFEGEGELRLTGLYKHALCSDDYIEISGGQITVESSVSDALHCKDYFEMTGEGGATSTPSSQSLQRQQCIDGHHLLRHRQRRQPRAQRHGAALLLLDDDALLGTRTAAIGHLCHQDGLHAERRNGLPRPGDGRHGLGRLAAEILHHFLESHHGAVNTTAPHIQTRRLCRN